MATGINERAIKNARAVNVTPYVIFSLLIINIMLAVSFVIRSNAEIKMPPVYAADAKSGSLTKLIALPYNSQSGLAMVNFTTNAFVYCLNLDFALFRDTLEECKSRYFSSAGYMAFEAAIQKTIPLEQIATGNAIIRSAIDGMPTLAEPGRITADLVYTIEIPFILDVKRIGRDSRPTKQVAIVTIARDSQPDTFGHFKIVRLIIEPRS